MSSANDTNANTEQQAAPTSGNNEGMLDGVRNQVNSTDTGSSLADLGNNASAMIGDSFNDVKNRVSSISPGDVVDNVRERIQSITNGNWNGDNGGNGQTAEQEDTSPSLEEIRLIEAMEEEKIAEFLQDKHMSNANIRRGK